VRRQDLRNRKKDRLKYKMAGTPIIDHVFIRWRGKVRHFDLGVSGSEWPLTETSEARELASEEKNQCKNHDV